MKLICVIASLFFFAIPAHAAKVRYELSVTKESINMSGRKAVNFALMVNRGIPAPTLEFTEGDEAEIEVKNGLEHEEVSIHWHGILLPPEEDGVPYVNTPPIHPGKSRVFRFTLRQHGTYWYHSHTGLQEQKGVYGAIRVLPKKKMILADHDVVAVLSDWSDENADQILKNLRKDGDFYQRKKNSVRSYWGAMRAGGLSTLLKGEWDRMGGMDLSDVGYDAFLLNGQRASQLVKARAGERVRVRVINASASTYFYVALGGLPFEVVSADGIDVKPVATKEFLVGMAETYDLLFTIPEQKNYELRATAQDVTGFASGWIGAGAPMIAPEKPAPHLYAPMHGGHVPAEGTKGSADHAEHSVHIGHGSPMAPEQIAGPVLETLAVEQLRALAPTTLPVKAPVLSVQLVLGGDMERYVWHINGKAIHQDRTIEIQENQVVRFTFVNETMMHHPMHLHGHFFRVINDGGALSPLKHTVDVPPHGTRTIEFFANEPGDWMLHCHNLYHLKTGMARVVKYSTFRPRAQIAELQKQDPHGHDHPYFAGMLDAATNRGRAQFRLMRTWDALELEVEARTEDQRWEWEGDFFYRRWLGKNFSLLGGGTSWGENQRAAVGAAYIFPMLIESKFLFDSKGDYRADLERKFQWTLDFLTGTKFSYRQHQGLEWEVSLLYGPSWHWAMGIVLTDDKLGAGVQWKF